MSEFADYSKLDSTRMEVEKITWEWGYEDVLYRMRHPEWMGHVSGSTSQPDPDTVVMIEEMKPGVVGIAADLDRPTILIYDDRIELLVQKRKPQRR